MAAALVLCLVGIMWGLPHHWDFAQDSVVPLGRLARIGAAGDEVTQYRYPPFHLFLLKVAFVPVRLLVNLARFNQKTGDTFFILTARLISAAMALGALRFIILLGKRLWDERVGLLAGALFILSPATLYYAKNANLDIPYIFWLAWALLVYVRILEEDRPRDYIQLGLLAAIAVCTKDQAYAFFLLMPVPIIIRIWKKKESPEAPGARWMKPAFGFLAFLIPFILIHNILFNPQAFWLHVKTIIGPGSEGWREFAPGPAGQLRLLLATILRLMDAWTVAGVVLAGIGLWLGLRGTEKSFVRRAVLLPAISYYIFFLCIVGYVYTRFALPLILVLAPFGGIGVIRLWESRPRNRLFGRVAAVILIGWLALAGLAVDIVMRCYSRYDAQMWLEKNCADQTLICYPREGDERDMPRLNEPLNAHPLLRKKENISLEAALRRKRPDVLVLSFDASHPTEGARSLRPSALIRRVLRDWNFGKAAVSRNASDRKEEFLKRLLSGKAEYTTVKRFGSPVVPGWFVPEVAESLNRTIVILVREKEP